MIETSIQYEQAKAELLHLEQWLATLQKQHPGPEKGLTKAGVRKMIARLLEDLTAYEARPQGEIPR